MSQRRSFNLHAVILLQVVLMSSGCYSYRSVTAEEQGESYPRSEDEIRVTLTDGSVIESPAYLHIETKERSDLIVGIGQERKSAMPFKGVISRGNLDSSKEISTSQGIFLVCWLKNKSAIVLKQGEYLVLAMQDPAGFWCAGTINTSGEERPFRSIISPVHIAKIEAKGFSYVNTALITAPIWLGIFVIMNFGSGIDGK